MDNKSRGLGKGLDALFGNAETYDTPISINEPAKSGVSKIPMQLIDRNMNQPRQIFDEEKLQELADSITEHGVLQPVLVTENNGRYLLVAGERRWRASKLAGLKEIPAIVKNLDDSEIAQIALIENLQRDDLNPIEEAQGIKNLMNEYGYTQEEVSKKLSKSRPAIANTLRLLNLPEFIIKEISSGNISAGHGRCLAGISNSALQKRLFEQTIVENLNVRQLEKLVKEFSEKAEKNKDKLPVEKPKVEYPEFKEFQETLQTTFGMKVDIAGSLEKGKITLNYTNREELEGFYELAKKIKK
ncbi:MAG: ParB/RepB/Spo0J family partition protein [Eubacteriales bacterium]